MCLLNQHVCLPYTRFRLVLISNHITRRLLSAAGCRLQVVAKADWCLVKTGKTSPRHLIHLKKSHLALGSFARPSPLEQHQNCRFKLGPFFFTVRKTQSSLCPLHKGAGGGPFIMAFHAVAAFNRFSSFANNCGGESISGGAKLKFGLF